MKSIEKTDDGLWIACFPYYSLGSVRRSLSLCLEGRWMILPVKGDSKAAELYRQKLEAFGIDARLASNGTAAVALPGDQVTKLVEYGVGKLRQNMSGIEWEADDFDREWIDAGRVTKKIKNAACTWRVTSDTLAAPNQMKELHECYGTNSAFVHDEDGSWTILYTYDSRTLLRIAGDLNNLALWMESALKIASQLRGCDLKDLLAGHSGISSDDRIWHGFPCFDKIRIPVHTVFEYWKAGLSSEDILKQMPYLRQRDLDSAAGLLRDLGTDTPLPLGLEDRV